MQPSFKVAILVLQSEGLVRRFRYVRFALQFTPTVIIPKPNQITFAIGHLSRDADLVAVEVVGLLAAFAVGQFAVDQVAGAVVVIGRAVVGFKAVEYVVGKAVARTVFICDS